MINFYITLSTISNCILLYQLAFSNLVYNRCVSPLILTRTGLVRDTLVTKRTKHFDNLPEVKTYRLDLYELDDASAV